jgi:hypothetical protein
MNKNPIFETYRHCKGAFIVHERNMSLEHR